MHRRSRVYSRAGVVRSCLPVFLPSLLLGCGAREGGEGLHAETLAFNGGAPAGAQAGLGPGTHDAGAPGAGGAHDAGTSSAGGDASIDAKGQAPPPYAPIGEARPGWYASFAAAALAQSYGPLPPLVSPDDVEASTFQGTYDTEVASVGASGFKPLGNASFVNQAGAAIAASYVLEPTGDAERLYALTDFSRRDGGARYTIGCEYYFANASPNTATASALRTLCATRGAAVSAWNAVEVKTRGIKLVRAKECALPSGAYGAYRADPADRGAFRYDWPNFLDRDPSYAQPCVGAFVDAEAKDASGTVLGRGWMFVKAVADLEAVPFPYQERDPQNGGIDSRDGAPRGEFVTSRWIYDQGVAAYLGQTPIWLLDSSLLQSPDGPGSKPEFFASKLPACGTVAKPPCILPKQPPFLFPMTGSAFSIRSAIDTSDPRWLDPESGRAPARNDFETANAVQGLVDVGADDVRNTIHFFEYQALQKAGVGLTGQAEQLSAMWHSAQVYRGLYTPGGDRMRVALVPLAGGLYLAIPDQGYVPLGTPSPALWKALGAADPTKVFGMASAQLGGNDFTIIDAMGEAQ